MEFLNIYEFEQNKVYLASVIGLAIANFLLFLSHVVTIIKLISNKEKLDSFLNELSCIHIFAQLIFSSLFFCILHRTHLANYVYLNISNLIGIALTFEWLCFYLYFYHIKNKIFALIHMLLPAAFIIVILAILLTIFEINKISEVVLINIAMISYLFMFISPGLNIVKLFKTKNSNYISLTNSIIGIIVNIFMAFFIIMLNKYKIISLGFITYVIISLIICIFQIIYYAINKGKNSNTYDLLENNNDSGKDKQYNLMNNNTIEE